LATSGSMGSSKPRNTALSRINQTFSASSLGSGLI
jgi:hypothetical protein